MKIKIIDLLNKISNGEKIPEKIKYKNKIWEYDEYSNDYKSEYTCLFEKLFDYKRTIEFINDETEIIEEPKKIEKITVREKTLGFPNGEWTARNMDKAFAIKINELIDEVNKLKEK